MHFQILPLFFVYVMIVSISCNKASSKEIDDNGGKEPETPSSVFTMGDFLVATDNLGRQLPGYDEVGPRKKERQVGLFYWLWHGDLRNESTRDYDVTKALRIDPARTEWDFADYYWTEPELGYYRSTDEWVMQKHLNLFTLLGIDFLYLDFTNAVVDSKELKLLLKLILQMQSKGYDPPRVVPFLNHEPVHKIEELYRDFYSNASYDDCWFIYEGKPLMFSPQMHPTNGAINSLFTWRHMWADFEDTEETKGRWRFFDNVPMRPAYNNGKLEQIVVSPGHGAPLWDNHIYGSKSSTSTHTPTYDIYWKTPDTGKGLFFEEQWAEAHRIGAPILCITGWNEWKAGAWLADEGLVQAGFKFQGRLLSVGECYFVDEFNEEFNRDLEPQTGEYTDNYFYQMAAHIRRYKGMEPMPEASGPKTISIDGKFDDWEDVLPQFLDFEGDAKQRNSSGSPRGTHYRNNTGRNDITESRVAYDSENIYFYVKTADVMTSWEDDFWMLLYIDSDRDKSTGWEGYDFLVNLNISSAEQTSIHSRQSGVWEKIGDCSFRQLGNQMEIEIPKELINQSETPNFYFHWADGIKKLDDINEFFVNGDSAPERRYNYHYKAN